MSLDKIIGLNCEGGFPLILLQWNCREITENYWNSRPFQEICERAVRAVSTGLHLDDTDWGLCCRFVLSHSQVSQSCLAFLLQAGRFWCWLWNLRRALKELVKLTSEGSEHHTFFNFVRFFFGFFSKVHVRRFTSYSSTTVCLQKHFCQLEMPGTFLKWENCSFSSSHVEYPHHLTLPDAGLSGTLRVSC